jgi:uncharacterized lipoprotein YmbA
LDYSLNCIAAMIIAGCAVVAPTLRRYALPL